MNKDLIINTDWITCREIEIYAQQRINRNLRNLFNLYNAWNNYTLYVLTLNDGFEHVKNIVYDIDHANGTTKYIENLLTHKSLLLDIMNLSTLFDILLLRNKYKNERSRLLQLLKMYPKFDKELKTFFAKYFNIKHYRTVYIDLFQLSLKNRHSYIDSLLNNSSVSIFEQVRPSIQDINSIEQVSNLPLVKALGKIYNYWFNY